MKEDKKSKALLIKLSEVEKEEIKRKAEALGFKSVSDYMRTTALNHKIVVKTDKDVVRQVRMIGNNINQIARQLNTYSDEVVIYDACKQMDEYKELLQLILDNIKKK